MSDVSHAMMIATMKPELPAHAKQRKAILDLIDANGLSAHRDAIAKLIKPAIGLKTRKATKLDSAIGATRVGGEPDASDDFEWPEGEEGPLLFVLQVNLADVAAFDLESQLPADGTLSLFSDQFGDDVRVFYWPKGTKLARQDWVPEEHEAFTECGVDVLAELQLPPHSSNFVGVDDAIVSLGDQHEVYWDQVFLAWHGQQRPGNAGEAGIHQMLGYAVNEDTGEQAKDEEVLFGFDSDDNADMEWGDVQCMWTLIKRNDLEKRAWDKLRAVT